MISRPGARRRHPTNASLIDIVGPSAFTFLTALPLDPAQLTEAEIRRVTQIYRQLQSAGNRGNVNAQRMASRLAVLIQPPSPPEE